MLAKFKDRYTGANLSIRVDEIAAYRTNINEYRTIFLKNGKSFDVLDTSHSIECKIAEYRIYLEQRVDDLTQFVGHIRGILLNDEPGVQLDKLNAFVFPLGKVEVKDAR